MELLPYEPGMAPALAAAYTAAFRGVPHCYPVSAEALGEVLAPTRGGSRPDQPPAGAAGGERRQAHPRTPLRSEAAFVAREGTAIRGFIHAAVECSQAPDEAGVGTIRCFWYERGHRLAGQALLDAATDHLARSGARQVDAYRYEHRYPFYHAEHANLSDRLDHVHALLAANGYERLGSAVVLDWPDYQVAEVGAPPISAEVSLEWTDGRGRRPGLMLRAHQGERQVGFCVCVSGGDYSAAEAAQAWVYTPWLTVAEEERGKGLGRYLLQRALRELRAVGYRHAYLCTADHNHRALLLYGNLGYRAVDWTGWWRRALS